MSVGDREIELKFATTPEAAKRLAEQELDGVAGRALESVYFDTDDRQLRSAGFSLRVRRDGDLWLQTVKGGRSGALKRYEWERPLRNKKLDTALLAETPLFERLNGIPPGLKPVFVTRLQRRSRRIRDADSDIEISLDEGEIVAGKVRLPVLEWELELKSGPPGALYGLAKRLSEVETLTLAFASKAERGYALADGLLEQATRFKRPKLRPGETVQEAFQAIAQACLRQLTVNAEVLGRNPGKEAVHQARVALRRTRVALSLFRPMIEDDKLEQVRAELRWLTGELADARELDVFITGTFRAYSSEVEDPADTAAFGSAILHALTVAYARAKTAIGSPRFRMLILSTAHWIECGEWSEDERTAGLRETTVERFARDALERCRKVMIKRGDQLDWQDPVARHKLRIRAKKMRYASEFFESVAAQPNPSRHDRFVEHLKALQEKLGELNDIATSRTTASTALAIDEEVDIAGVRRRALSAGLIVGARHAGTPKLVRQAKRAYRHFADAPIWWKS